MTTRTLLITACFASIVSASPAVLADVIHVPGEVSTIQQAIDFSLDGDEIIVAPGSYDEQLDLIGRNIVLRSSGGAAQTIIDPVSAIPVEGAEDVTVITCDNGETAATIIEGFTIRGGNGFNGGGMFILDSSPTVRDCIFEDNVSYTVIGDDLQTPIGGGGAVFAINASSEFTNCVFRNNQTVVRTRLVAGFGEVAPVNGGGGAVNANLSDLRFTDCDFSENLAANFAQSGIRGAGAAVRSRLGHAVFERCSFTLNRSGEHGGAIHSTPATLGSLTVIDCTFTENLSVVFQSGGFDGDGAGGAIYNHQTEGATAPLIVRGSWFIRNDGMGGGAIYSASGTDTELIDCVFIGNRSSTLRHGGAVHLRNIEVATSVFIKDCFFGGNSGEDGGALFIRGNYITNDPITSTIVNCVFTRNTSYGDGGGAIVGEDTQFLNCTFANNRVIPSDASGGAIANGGLFSDTFVARNCIFWGNRRNGEPDVPDNFEESPDIQYSLVEGGYAGTANFDAMPLFVDADGPDDVLGTEDDDLHLSDLSPAIDMGNTSALPTGVNEDFDDNPRVVDGDGDTVVSVDVGAYEFQPGQISSCPFDTTDIGGGDPNGEVDVGDFFALLQNWGPCGAICPWDVTSISGGGPNDEVDVGDFFALLQNWGACP